MSTGQKSIRDEVFLRITAALPDVLVFRSPRRALDDSEIPCVCVFSHGDRPTSEEEDHSQAHERIYTLRVEVIANGRPEEDATDELVAKIRTAILTDDTLGGACRRITWASQVWSGDEGDPVQALSGLDFSVFYLWSPE